MSSDYSNLMIERDKDSQGLTTRVNRRLIFRAGGALVGGAALLRTAPASRAQEGEFPPAGVDIVYHTLRVGVDVGGDGELDEEIELRGAMLIQRSEPFENEEGRRQIDFQAMSWAAAGWSNTLTVLC